MFFPLGDIPTMIAAMKKHTTHQITDPKANAMHPAIIANMAAQNGMLFLIQTQIFILKLILKLLRKSFNKNKIIADILQHH